MSILLILFRQRRINAEHKEAIAEAKPIPKQTKSNEDMLAEFMDTHKVTVIHTDNIFIGHTMHNSGNRG